MATKYRIRTPAQFPWDFSFDIKDAPWDVMAAFID
jgi:hypothetical protein